MGNKPPPPPQPQKTVKGTYYTYIIEMVKEFSKTIQRLKREFNREIMRMEMQSKKLKTDLEKSIKNKEPRVYCIYIPVNSTDVGSQLTT